MKSCESQYFTFVNMYSTMLKETFYFSWIWLEIFGNNTVQLIIHLSNISIFSWKYPNIRILNRGVTWRFDGIFWDFIFMNFLKMSTVWKFANFFPHHDILQNFRQINFFTKELYCKSIWRKIFAVGKNFRNFHTVCHQFVPKIPSDQLFH